MNDVARALAYMQWHSLAGRVRQRVRRLKQPKYLVGAIAGAAYMYFFVFRHFLGRPGGHGGARFAQVPPEFLGVVAPIAAVGLLLVLASAWLLPSDRAALRFSEAETDFLFPAPISRTGLIHFSVLRAQLAIFVSVFLMSLLLRRGGAVGINPLQYATALWLVFATVRLHYLGASFTRERLLDVGIRPMWRRAGVALLLLALLAAGIGWARTQPAPPVAGGARAIAAWVAALLGHGPVAVVLAPLRWIVAPLLSTTGTAFLRALPGAVALLLLHYAWVVRSQVSFEEASIALAKKRAETRSAMRDGRMRFGRKAARARRAPFALAARGPAPTAFLWKGLISAGPFWRVRTLVIATVAAVVLTQWLGASPTYRPLLKVVGAIALGVAGWGTLAGPMLVHRGLRETLDRLDVLRAMPLRGWQIALGQLLTPVAMLVPAQWVLLLTAGLAFAGSSSPGWLTPGMLAAIAVAAIALAPTICLLMLCVPFAGVLLCPGWSAGGRGGGVDVMGQRLIFGGVYLLTLATALLPASLVAGALLFVIRALGSMPLAVGVGALAAAAVLAAEVMLLVRWLGGRIERFDVSTEMR
ncbi:putative ABC exporter domain-containing protein [Cognatilysobacter segetis]|uniref:putative ABC exporter domain-containing protein n=1 Tax=Cognatilysobacter segetis TaxID=2492394 RepID=UPI00106067CE|nr:putative ABC exporter domain-containing protein [Lysobacter segetis]